MRNSKSKTAYFAVFFFVLMLINIIYASLSDMNGVQINGSEIAIPVEIIILNAFMFGFILNILSTKIGRLLRKGK